MFEIHVREVPEQIVVSESHRHVRQEDLPDRNRAAMSRMGAAADELGGPVGSPFTVFPDEDYDPEDIDFEVCVPVKSGDGAPEGVVVRTEPAHREAFVRLRKRETYPPTIGDAYQAVSQWIVEQGLTETGPGREVYFTDFIAAGDDDEVFDVAFPIS
jgi:effector-binding domain-containing protein